MLSLHLLRCRLTRRLFVLPVPLSVVYQNLFVGIDARGRLQESNLLAWQGWGGGESVFEPGTRGGVLGVVPRACVLRTLGDKLGVWRRSNAVVVVDKSRLVSAILCVDCIVLPKILRGCAEVGDATGCALCGPVGGAGWLRNHKRVNFLHPEQLPSHTEDRNLCRA